MAEGERRRWLTPVGVYPPPDDDLWPLAIIMLGLVVLVMFSG